MSKVSDSKWTILSNLEDSTASRVSASLRHNWLDKYVPECYRGNPVLFLNEAQPFLQSCECSRQYFASWYHTTIDLGLNLPFYLSPLPDLFDHPDFEDHFNPKDRELLTRFFCDELSKLPSITKLARGIEACCNEFACALDAVKESCNSGHVEQQTSVLYKVKDGFHAVLKQIPSGVFFVWPV